MDNDWMNEVKKNGFMSVSIEYHCEELDKVLKDIIWADTLSETKLTIQRKKTLQVHYQNQKCVIYNRAGYNQKYLKLKLNYRWHNKHARDRLGFHSEVQMAANQPNPKLTGFKETNILAR